MINYYFKTNEFGISDKGIHLLRSGFNYKTINFTDIDELKIEPGKVLHNWLVIFLISTVIFIGGFYLTMPIMDALLEGDVSRRRGKLILLLLIPCIAGGYFAYTSLRTDTLLKIKYGGNKKEKLPLKEIITENKMAEFELLLIRKIRAGRR